MKTAPARLWVALILAALLALTACSGSTAPSATPPAPSSTADATTPSPSQEPSASATPSVAVPTVEVDPKTGAINWCDPKTQPAFTGPATEKFGAKKVMAAYCMVVDLEMDLSYQLGTMGEQAGALSADNFYGPQPYMGEVARTAYDTAVRTILSGKDDEDAQRIVWSFVDYNLVGDGSEVTMADPAVAKQTFTAAKTWAEGEILIMEFTVSADFQGTKKSDGKTYNFPVAKKLRFSLSENPTKDNEIPWFIEGWEHTHTFGEQSLSTVREPIS